jgi:hypothetical protein
VGEHVAISLARGRRCSERGSTPIWLPAIVVAAGLVLLMWAIAGPHLNALLQAALTSVRR